MKYLVVVISDENWVETFSTHEEAKERFTELIALRHRLYLCEVLEEEEE